MLPDDAKARRAQAHEALKQTRVGNHFTTVDPANDHKKLDLFTQELFKEAAIQWLVKTDQVSRLNYYLRAFQFQITALKASQCVRAPHLPEYDRYSRTFNEGS